MADVPFENCPNCLAAQPVTALKCGACGVVLDPRTTSKSALPDLFIAVGVALLIGGAAAFYYGSANRYINNILGIDIRGVSVVFTGSILAMSGGGLAAFGLLRRGK